MSNIVSRQKLLLENGKTVYVYGDEAAWPKLPSPVKSSENAGHYDRERNLVHFTEPTHLEEGATHAEKAAARKGRP
jgi:hypothetical protein